jgi:hypothetical protein
LLGSFSFAGIIYRKNDRASRLRSVNLMMHKATSELFLLECSDEREGLIIPSKAITGIGLDQRFHRSS